MCPAPNHPVLASQVGELEEATQIIALFCPTYLCVRARVGGEAQGSSGKLPALSEMLCWQVVLTLNVGVERSRWARKNIYCSCRISLYRLCACLGGKSFFLLPCDLQMWRVEQRRLHKHSPDLKLPTP